MSATPQFNPGPWRIGRPGTVVCDTPVPDMSGSDDVGYYFGHLVAESLSRRNAPLIAAAPDLYAVAASFEVRPPDADGDVWLHIHDPNTGKRGAVNLGKADHIVAQAAALLEKLRRAALAKAVEAA